MALNLWAVSSPGPAIVGQWKYSAYSYEGRRQPMPNPDLDLRFTFFADKTSTLKWSYANEEGFCERQGLYEIDNDGWLFQKVTWVNPGNHFSCSRDPDMQMGKESLTRVQIKEDELWLELELNGQPFIYILTVVSEHN